jgi:hypothetical protein
LLRRRDGPGTGPARAVGLAGRRRCDARPRAAPPNSLRSPAVRCAQTTAASMSTKRAVRADPADAPLAALKGPAPGLARRLRVVLTSGGRSGCTTARSWRSDRCMLSARHVAHVVKAEHSLRVIKQQFRFGKVYIKGFPYNTARFPCCLRLAICGWCDERFFSESRRFLWTRSVCIADAPRIGLHLLL